MADEENQAATAAAVVEPAPVPAPPPPPRADEENQAATAAAVEQVPAPPDEENQADTAAAVEQVDEDGSNATDGTAPAPAPVPVPQPDEDNSNATSGDAPAPDPAPAPRRYPILCNDDGAPVAFGTSVQYLLYCGREGTASSDSGRCGPSSGPQCPSCQRLYRDPAKRWELLSLIFPSLNSAHFVRALRKSGGSWTEAAQHLRQLGAPHVPNNVAFPPASGSDGPRPPAAVDSGMVASVLEVLGHIGEGVAQAALRRSNHQVDGAIAYLLDTPAEELTEAVTQDEQRANAYEVAQFERVAQRARTYNDVLEQALPAALQEEEEGAKPEEEESTEEPLTDEEKKTDSDVEMAEAKEEDADVEMAEAEAEEEDGKPKADENIADENMADGMEAGLEANGVAIQNAEARGHKMTMLDTTLPEAEAPLCVICATPVQSICGKCRICESCIESQEVVDKCPQMGNGAHVHHHPLTLLEQGSRSRRKCSVQGPECKVLSSIYNMAGWRCSACDFNVCVACMSKDIPEGYHRRFGRRTIIAPTTEEDNGEGEEDQPLPADSDDHRSDSESESEDDDSTRRTRQLQERFSAVAWEGSLPEPPVVEVLVGTGLVGNTQPPPQPPQPAQVPPAPSTTNNNGTNRSTVAALATESQQALKTFHQNAKTITACDIQLMEDILHRAEQLGEGKTLKMLRDTVAAGNVAIAGALALAKDYAPSNKRKREEENSEEAVARCFCGDAIDFRGAVGCLNGHSMHPDCASDVLLGGGLCPSCREPLYFPRVPGPESRIAKQNAAAQVRQCRQEEEDKMKATTNELAAKGDYSFLNVGDIVRISSDQGFCSTEMMKHSGHTGWCSDLSNCCGLVGGVTQIVREGEDDEQQVVAVRVKTQEFGHAYTTWDNGSRCPNCRLRRTDAAALMCIHCSICKSCCEASKSCPNSKQEWFWAPSCVTLVASTSTAALFHPSLATKDAVLATEAERHILRLRAELKAVSAGRAAVKEELEKALLESKVDSLDSVISEDLSAADQQRARHLLMLARQWGDSKEVVAERALLKETVRAGDVDSAARFVRRRNASLMADALYWADATTHTREYVVDFSEIVLLAWPSTSAPKTGYKLKPMARFHSKQEWVDKTGALWLQVDEASFVDLGANDGKVHAIKSDRKLADAMMGANVVRGPDWNHGDQDGGEGTVGVVTSVNDGRVTVCWRGDDRTRGYRAGVEGKFDLIFANLTPPPQGWLCVRPGGVGAPAVVARGRSSLRCFSCGDGLLPQMKVSEHSFRVVRATDNLKAGETLLVAATLEPVKVISSEGGKVLCCFDAVAVDPKSETLPAGVSFTVVYNTEDLVYPKTDQGAVADDDDVVLIDGRLRSRRELVLIYGNEVDARKAWASAKQSTLDHDNDKHAAFPSCLAGHLLHARCLQGALMSGNCCPVKGCNEPLWQPQIRLLRSDGDACCGHTPEDQSDEVMVDEIAGLAGQSAAEVRAGSGVAGADINNVESARVGAELKMCPCCFSGPLFNTNCEDMQAHHGQCSAAAVGRRSCGFAAPANDIASKLSQVSGTTTVADVLPKCPTCNVVVMFNGCMACGHLFTEIQWPDMPKWDPQAKKMLDLNIKKREAAAILAKEIRRESGMLQYERDGLRLALAQKLQRGQTDDSALVCLPCLPPPAKDFAVIGCGPNCSRSHSSEGNCLRCGRDFGHHNGHTCSDGRRGEWPML